MKRKLIIAISITIVGILLLMAGCYLAVVWNAAGRTYDNARDVPPGRVGLLLATSPITRTGGHNFHFDNRITAADELFKAGKIDYIIASGGDYTTDAGNPHGCDEPTAIRDSLVARGVPADRIILDYEGTRTLNSIAKARAVYGLDSVTLISQKYHNERALYLADRCCLHAVGYNAAPTPVFGKRVKNELREILARVKLFLDILLDTQPTIRPQNLPIPDARQAK